MKMERKRRKKTQQVKPEKKRRWCILFGFNRADHSDTGCLAFRDEEEIRLNPRLRLYKIVKNASEAKYFPCENYYNLSSFAPPEKWLEFFSREKELKDWKFHLVKKTSTNEKKED